MSRLPTTAVTRLYSVCVAETNDPYFGLSVARHVSISNLHALGYAMAASSTLMEVCRRIERYFFGARRFGPARTPLFRTWFGLVGYTLAFSRTVGEALERLARYSRIISETIGIVVESGTDGACVALIADPHFELLRHPIDNRLASALSGCSAA